MQRLTEAFSQMATESAKQSSTTAREQTASLERVVDKTLGLVASKDPMTFQAVQAMGAIPSGYDPAQQYDPSDEGEITRITQRGARGEDGLSGDEIGFLLDAYDAPGNEYVEPGPHAQRWSSGDTDPAS